MGTCETTPIRRLLVANRGEIARRVFRTARELGIETVAVHSIPDRGAPFTTEADLAVELDGSTSAQTYLDIDQVLAAARSSQADAVHPGYGFLAENPEFAEAVIDAGLTWIGPPPKAIRAMALKVEAKELVAAAGVPLVPGATLAPDASPRQITDAAAALGYPLLVKASAGGGGRGMRLVESAAGIAEAVAAARREAGAAFANPAVFLERFITHGRHIEVQVFADQHGNVVHLFERECSIQRRHQKIIEEAPAVGLEPRTAAAMYEAAVAAARAISYAGAGTVEFLVDSGGDYYFLEMNTRLQVEHPVTELTTGTDLVSWQIAVAEGRPLPLSQAQIGRSGHAIEARLYAEDPSRGYLPDTGIFHRFSISGPARVDSGIETGGEVSSHYDPMLAKVIATAPARDQAARKLAYVLRAAELFGPVTNRDCLVAILESAAFGTEVTTTAFLDEHPELLAARVPDSVREQHLVAAADTVAAPGQLAQPVAAPGWRNVPAVADPWAFTWRAGADEHTAKVGIEYARSGRRVLIDGERAEPSPHRIANVLRAGDAFWVHDGRWQTRLRLEPRFPDTSVAAGAGGPSAPVPGTVSGVLVAVGDEVAEGQALVVLEAMKMEHRIAAHASGTVAEVLVRVGDSVDAHQVLVTITTAAAAASGGEPGGVE